MGNKMTGEALKQIVDLLQPVAALAGGTPFEHSEVIQRCVDASEIALKALAQPAQEPVAWMREDATLKFAEGKVFAVGQPFYTTPQKCLWVGLTDEEIEVIEALKAPPVHPDFVDCDDWMNFARAIEAKLKDKNTC